MSLWALTLEEFQRELASSAPTPGGGAAACVCGAFGLGLVSMALEISTAAPRAAGAATPSVQGLPEVLAAVRGLGAELRAHADRDAAAFSRYMDARRLPRTTPAERAARELALDEAALAAARAPLAAARDLVRALDLALEAAPLIKATLASDVLGGSDLLGGAIAAVLRNVDINLSSVRDVSSREQLAAERQALARAARVAQGEIEAHFRGG